MKISFAPVDPVADLSLIHEWVGQERARFWGMGDYTRDEVGEVYAFLDSLPTHHAYLAREAGVPVALLQTYEPGADPVGDCYDVLEGDLGAHFMMAPPTIHRPGFTEGVLRSFAEWVFGDPAIRRIVAEPDARNDKAVLRLTGFGFERGPVIELPEKRAQLVFLAREKFESAVSVG